MPSICVSGAGNAAVNGTYTQSGSVWIKDASTSIQFENDGGDRDYAWMLRFNGNLEYQNASGSATPTSTAWLTAYSTAPAPTVTEGACGATSAPTVTSISPTTGTTAGGTSVTITGTGLTGASAVSIGGTAATGVTVVSSTSITATSPAGSAGASSVLVTTPSGTNAANSLFTFVAPSPSPTTANIIRPKRSSTASATPTGLVAYEIAVNITDKKIWVADAAGSPVLMSELNDLPPSIDGGVF